MRTRIIRIATPLHILKIKMRLTHLKPMRNMHLLMRGTHLGNGEQMSITYHTAVEVAGNSKGVEALRRLLRIALGNSGQCKIVANFLLSCYNGDRFKFDLTDFRSLDHALFEDCMCVLRMDYQPTQEVHTYFKNGGRIWEQMAKDWGIRDYTRECQP